MYDYEYEEDVLISLQMLKYLHDNSPERFQHTLDMFRFSYQVDTKVDVLQYGLGDRAAHWKQLYDDLKKQARASVSVPAMASAIQNTPPYFHTGMEENPRAVHGASSPPFRKMTT